jgi:hypothetical protein
MALSPEPGRTPMAPSGGGGTKLLTVADPLRRDSEFRFGHFFQPTEDRGCEVRSFAETTARYRGQGTGGFPAATTAHRGLFARGFVFLATADRGGEGTPGEVVCTAGDGEVLRTGLVAGAAGDGGVVAGVGEDMSGPEPGGCGVFAEVVAEVRQREVDVTVTC